MFSDIGNNYQKSIQYLYDLQYSGIKLGLHNISELLTWWGNPQQSWPAVHIAGTNGKGSTALFIFNILKAAGLRVGLYTSPHLIDFNERIRVNDELIPWDNIVEYINMLRPIIEKIQPTFFEATSAMAFRYFADQSVDIAVIETGLGGRLDATNLVNPVATVITPIDYDHQQFLGRTLKKIAAEKAGIIKEKVPCYTNNLDPEIVNIIKNECIKKNTKLFKIDYQKRIANVNYQYNRSQFDLILPNRKIVNLSISLAGTHQLNNAILAAFTASKLPDLKLTKNQIKNGLQDTSWPGRLQIIEEKPFIILDVAHNPQGFESAYKHLKKHFPDKKIFVLVGLSRGKDYRKVANIIKKYSSVIGLVDNFSNKSLPTSILDSALKKMEISAFVFKNIEEGYSIFRKKMNEDNILLIIGSHYLIGDFIQKIQNS